MICCCPDLFKRPESFKLVTKLLLVKLIKSAFLLHTFLSLVMTRGSDVRLK